MLDILLRTEQYLWREKLAFVLSAAVVVTTAQREPKSVRGVLGRLLNRVLNT